MRAYDKPPRLERLLVGAPAPILFISDLHLRPENPGMAKRTAEACAGLKPALILLGGDMAEYDEGLETTLSELRKVFPSTPLCAVPGNNDDGLFEGDRAAQAAVYAAYDAEYLLNAARRFTLAGRAVELAGVDDAYSHTADATGLFSSDPDAYRILLSHEPLRSLLDAGPDLMLCGHTHGGQLNLLGATCYLIGYERSYGYALLSGRKRFGKTLLLVSRGIGYSKWPLRVGAQSEIHYII